MKNLSVLLLALAILAGCDKMQQSVHGAAQDVNSGKSVAGGDAKGTDTANDKMSKDASDENTADSGKFREAEDQSSAERRAKARQSLGMGNGGGK